jgi:hypothetical protein
MGLRKQDGQSELAKIPNFGSINEARQCTSDNLPFVWNEGTVEHIIYRLDTLQENRRSLIDMVEGTYTSTQSSWNLLPV